MPSASKILGDLVSSAGAISVTSGVANTAITGTITTAQIADSAITTDKVAASAIVTADIADANVTDAKIVSVSNTKITGVLTASQLANTAVTAGVYGGSSNSALITIDAQGRITSASNVAAGSGQIQTQVFTSPGTWTKPSTASQVRVTVVGGGGGSISPGFSADGNPGGTSSFGPAVSATGGTGRSAPLPSGVLGTPGTGTVSSGTLLKTSNAGAATHFLVSGIFNNPVSSSPGPGATTYSTSTNYSAAGWAGVNANGPGGYGGTSIAIVPVSAPVAVTVGSGGSSGSSPGTGGVSGAVVVEFVG